MQVKLNEVRQVSMKEGDNVVFTAEKLEEIGSNFCQALWIYFNDKSDELDEPDTKLKDIGPQRKREFLEGDLGGSQGSKKRRVILNELYCNKDNVTQGLLDSPGSDSEPSDGNL